MTQPLLPEPFEELAPFLDWALEPELARTEKKAAASVDECRAFYDAMMLRINEILDYLDGDFGGDMPAPAHRLYLMLLSLVEVANFMELEIYKAKRREAVEACHPLRFVPQH